MREETTPAYAVIDCEDDARWSGLAECVVALFGRDDERWTHYRAYDDEFPSDEEFASLKGIVITGSSHRAEFARASAPRWMDCWWPGCARRRMRVGRGTWWDRQG